MGSMSASSCRCSMFVSCVHPVAVLNAAFCMTCSMLMLVEDGRGILQRYRCRLLARPKIYIQSSIVKTSTYFFSCSIWMCSLLRKNVCDALQCGTMLNCIHNHCCNILIPICPPCGKEMQVPTSFIPRPPSTSTQP